PRLATPACSVVSLSSSRHSTNAKGSSAALLLLLSRPRFVDAQRPAADVFAIELRDGRLGFALVRHLDETETARAARLTIHEDLDGRNFAKRTEGIAKLVFAHAVRQIAYVDIHHRRSHAVASPDEALNQRREIERRRQNSTTGAFLRSIPRYSRFSVFSCAKAEPRRR